MVRIDIDIRWRRKRGQAQRRAIWPAFLPWLTILNWRRHDLCRVSRPRALGRMSDRRRIQERFPAFAEELSKQIGLHRALEAVDDETRRDASRTGSPASESPGSSPQFDAGYEILEEIGRGGMGVVYKARQVALHRFVALKMVRAVDASNQELLARFRSEARAVASLHHPHIVQVYDFGEHNGLPFLAMELIEGGTLAARLHGLRGPPVAAAELMIKLAGAVQYAHDRQVIHRDLKPANVLIASDTEGLEVKISDFGLGKFFHEDVVPEHKAVRISRHTQLHGAGTGQRRGTRRRSCHRHLFPGRDPVRIVDRPAAVSWRIPDGNAAATRRRTHFVSPAGPAHAARSRNDLR